LDNIKVSTTHISLEEPISVGSYYFAGDNSVIQVANDTSTDPSHTDGEQIVLGINAPISPNQVFRAAEEGVTSVSESSMYHPRSVRRMVNKDLVVADTYNDRILVFNENGELLEGFGSINYNADKTFPISACVDIRTGILYVVWSKNISFDGVNINGFVIQHQNKQAQLIEGYDLINNKSAADLSGADSGQVMAVYLSAQNLSLLLGFPEHGSRIQISTNAIPGGIDADSVFYGKIVNALGIPLYIGNFFYTSSDSPAHIQLFSPTFANRTEDNEYYIANAKYGVNNFSFLTEQFPDGMETVNVNPGASGVPSILKVDPSKDSKIIFFSNLVHFSPFAPGRIMEISGEDILLIAGLKPGGTMTDPSKSDDPDVEFNFRNVHGTDEDKIKQKKTLEYMFFGGENSFVGAFRTVSTATSGGSEFFKYDTNEGAIVTDAGVDPITGNYVIAESAFTKQSGRVIQIDGSGNIVFSFGEGLYNMINDMEIQADGSIVISS